MRTWSLKAGDPCTLVLSADFRFCDPDYFNDHTWEIKTGTGDFNLLELQTTYGLRARSMRIFPGFILDGKKVTRPEKFTSPPRLIHFFPNFLQFDFAPFPEVQVSAEFWLPSSQTLACRMSFHNQTSKTLNLQYELFGQLTPLDGQVLAPTRLQYVNILAGKTSGLEPVLFLTGGPLHGAGPGTSLLLDVKLSPSASRNFTWVQAALPETQASFDLARRTAARPWDREKARILLTNTAQTVAIHTGDPDWDAALAFSQVTALRLFFNAGEYLPYPSFVQARQPEHGYSTRTDGRDHGTLWSGQNIQDVSYISSLLPAAPELAAGLLRNFLSTVDATGFIDGQPGLAGQRSHRLSASLLADLAWRIFRQTGDRQFLQEVYPGLLSFFKYWFDRKNDRDGDGFPEWEHPSQTGFEENPAFNNLHPGDQGADIRSSESPALAASLFVECKSLINLAGELHVTADLEFLHSQAETLRTAVMKCWNKPAGFYLVRDRDTHLSLRSRSIFKATGSGEFKLEAGFKAPVRLLLRLNAVWRDAPDLEIHLQGKYLDRPVSEKFDRSVLRWEQGQALVTSQFVYDSLHAITVTGLDPKARLVIRSIDLTQEDQTGFLPLWAGMPGESESKVLIDHKLSDPQTFWHPAGVSTLSLANKPTRQLEELSVQLPWNHLIGEGLLAYGRRELAADLVTRLMETVIHNLKLHGSFFNEILARDGTGFGERNTVRGLLPVSLFLQVLGVHILSDRSVRLEGNNPFPWPITIKVRGLTVVRRSDETLITFPDGNTTRITDTAACLVSQGSESLPELFKNS